MKRRLTWVVALAATTTLLVATSSTPAWADPPVPTNYRSTLTGVPDGIQAWVVGGDSFLAIEVPAGTTVEVPGYEGEPYLRVLPDGTVERNERSEARWLNEARYGALETDIAAVADNDAPPLWQPVATGGTYAWHDHRIHWMGVREPDHIDASGGTQLVNEWRVPVTIDGTEAVIVGELVWQPDTSPAVPVAVLVLAAVAVAVVAARRQLPGALLGAVVAGVAAVIGGAMLTLGLPPGATANPLDAALPVFAVLAAALAAAAARRRPVPAALLTGLAAAPAIAWAITRLGAFQRPVLPAEPTMLLRVLVATALGAGIAAVAAGLWAFLSAGMEHLETEDDPGPAD